MAFKETEDTRKKREAAEAMQYREGTSVADARNRLNALQAPNAYASAYNARMGSLINDYQNRKPFAYDVNADALYRQYTNKYQTAGRQAMADTIGKASAMTGGYGNSYAASAGAQAYNAYMQQMNDVIPEMYNMAYQRYQDEGDQMRDLYNMYGAQESLDYGQYRDAVSDYLNRQNYLTERYDTERQWDRGSFDADRETALNRADAAYQRELAAYQQGVSEDQFDRNLALQYNQLNDSNMLQYAKLGEEQRQFDLGGTAYQKAQVSAAQTPAASTGKTTANSGSGSASGGKSVASALWGDSGSTSSTKSGTGSSGESGEVKKFFSSVMSKNEWAKHGSPGGSYQAYLNGVANALLKEERITEYTAEEIAAAIKNK